MGLFDAMLDGLIDLPGNVAEKLVETVVRAPEMGIKVVTGVVSGIESGVDKVSKTFD
jgi:hypothetical protein